jgi:hypothetical protein
MEANRLATLVARFKVGTGRKAAPPAAVPAPTPVRAARPMPAVQGNAALAASDEDWQEF